MQVLLLSFSVKQKKVVKKVANRYFANNSIKGTPVVIDLVNSVYSVEEDATILSFSNPEYEMGNKVLD